MSVTETIAERRTRLLNRLYARLARRRKAATGFVSQPEPRTIGSFARGRQLIAGNLLFAGYLVESPRARASGRSRHRTPPSTPSGTVSAGSTIWRRWAAMAARAKAQRWLWGWIDAHDLGRGPGWTPDLTGRRVIRWINHAIFLMQGRSKAQSDAFFRSLARQTWFLSKRWPAAAPGLPRFEALTGLIYAGLSLEGMEALADPAVRALAQECAAQIDDEGGLPTRNPEELLEVFTLLIWAAEALREAGRGIPAAQLEAAIGASPRPCGCCATPMAAWRGSMAAAGGWRGGSITRLRRAMSSRRRPRGCRWAMPGSRPGAPA